MKTVTTGLTKTAAKRIQAHINRLQKQLTNLRKREDGGGGYGIDRTTGKPTLCQQLVDEMQALGSQLRGEAA